MKPDTERLMQAYLEVYRDFEDIYLNSPVASSYGRVTRVYRRSEDVMPLETAKLFEIAMNDSLLGEILKEEILQRYQEILEAEQAKQEAEEEAEAGEAMVI